MRSEITDTLLFFRIFATRPLADDFKFKEFPWLWEFLIEELGLPKDKLYITVFEGSDDVPKDNDSFNIWSGIVPKEKIFYTGVDKNWWSRSGVPKNMPRS